MNATCSVGKFSHKTCNTFASWNYFIFINIYIPIMEFLFCFIPIMCITAFFYFVSCIFCLMNRCQWWIYFIKIWWHFLSHDGRYIFDILIDLNLNARLKNTPQLLWVRGKLYSTVLSEKCHGSWKKEKYNLWYIKYKVLNENWIFCTKNSETDSAILFLNIWTLTLFYQGYF